MEHIKICKFQIEILFSNKFCYEIQFFSKILIKILLEFWKKC